MASHWPLSLMLLRLQSLEYFQSKPAPSLQPFILTSWRPASARWRYVSSYCKLFRECAGVHDNLNLRWEQYDVMYNITEYFNLFLCSMSLSSCCYSRWLLTAIKKENAPMILLLKRCLVVSLSLCLWNGFVSFIVREAKINQISNKLHGLRYHSRALSQKSYKK